MSGDETAPETKQGPGRAGGEATNEGEVLAGRPRLEPQSGRKQAQARPARPQESRCEYVEGKESEGGDRPADSMVGRPKLDSAEMTGTVEQDDLASSSGLVGPPTLDGVIRENRVRLPSVLFRTGTVLFVGTAAAVLGLFLYAQVLQVVARLSEAPLYLKIPGWILLALLLGVLLAAAIRVIWLYVHLRVNRQISFRQVCRDATAAGHSDAIYDKVRGELKKYLQEYPVEKKTTGNVLMRAGVSEDSLARLREAKRRLMEDRPIDGRAWVLEYKEQFQGPLDNAARERVSSTARRAAIGAAVSPHRLVDTAVVLYCSFGMVGDLCSLYNRRVNKLQTLSICGWVFVDSLVAGGLQEGATKLKQAGTRAASLAGGLPPGLKEVLDFVGARTLEASVNWFLARRLGRKCQGLLQPLESRP